MSDHAIILRGAGLRATPQRLALLHALGKARGPQTAEELHAKADADLVTIYRNLQSLVKAGIVHEVRFKDTAVRFELSHGHHHHIVCTSCGLIEELEGCRNSPLEHQALHASSRFSRINDHALEFFGICRSCA
ncbi:transcriptional repressor [bacterium]|nr:transcriptional repressor [bacterium]